MFWLGLWLGCGVLVVVIVVVAGLPWWLLGCLGGAGVDSGFGGGLAGWW